MTETSVSLLQRIRIANNHDAWQKLVDIYQPMIHAWLRGQHLPAADVDDVAQEILAVVVRRAPDFERERTGSFRKWLRTITVNCLRDHWKRNKRLPIAGGDSALADMLNQLEDPESDLSRIWDKQHDQHVTKYLLDQIRNSFTTQTWEAFQRVALRDESPDEVAASLGMTVNAVFIAKSRVLAKLRQEGAGLVD